MVDGNQIQQILLNLLINARQAMRGGLRYVRHAPELRFVADHSVERGARIEEILRTLPPREGEGEAGPEGSSEPGSGT